MTVPLQNVNLKTSDSFETLLDMVYPIGSIYLSAVEASPATFLGGSWEKVGTGRCLAGAGKTDGEKYWNVETDASIEVQKTYSTIIPLDGTTGKYLHFHTLPIGCSIDCGIGIAYLPNSASEQYSAPYFLWDKCK